MADVNLQTLPTMSSLIAQGTEFPLRKPAGFHWDIFLLGLTTGVAGLLGIPFPNGLIPQAPFHTNSLCVTKQVSDESETGREKGHTTRVVDHVVEQRVSNFMQGLLTLGTMTGPLLIVIHLIPDGVLAGLFFVMGVQALEGNGITLKMLHLARERSLTTASDPLSRIQRTTAIWCFVALELFGFGATFAITQTIAAIGFPIIILLLIPLRTFLLPKCFKQEELSVLDAPTASPFTMESVGGNYGEEVDATSDGAGGIHRPQPAERREEDSIERGEAGKLHENWTGQGSDMKGNANGEPQQHVGKGNGLRHKNCTYDQPSNRRRNPHPHYVEKLEKRLRRAESLLRDVLPDVDLDDASYDAAATPQPQVKQERDISSSGIDAAPAISSTSSSAIGEAEKEALLESMVHEAGSLDLDDQGHWDFYGQSSGMVFLRRMREQFGDLLGKPEDSGTPFTKSSNVSSRLNSPTSGNGSPLDPNSTNTRDLPARACARKLCSCALDDAAALLRFVHQPTFYMMFDRAYDTPQKQLTSADHKFLPLFYSVIALGCLFAKAEQSMLQSYGYESAAEQGKKKHAYVVQHAKIREVEKEMQQWMEELPMALRPGGEALPELLRVQQLLRMSYAHIQIILYRPFLHYASPSTQALITDKRTYACAAACVSVSRNVIHITSEMKRSGLLTGAYWFSMYTTFFAILSLLFYAIENPHTITSEEILRDAHEGRDTLASLSPSSMAADRSSQTLARLFEQLPEALRTGRLKSVSAPAKKRSAPSKNPAVQELSPLPSMETIKSRMQSPTDRSGTSDWNFSSQLYNSPLSRNPQRSMPNADVKPRDSSQQALPHNIPSNRSYQQHDPPPGIQSPSGTQAIFSSLQSPEGPGFPDLSTMMFPSNDPFAYPNQPMITLENYGGGPLAQSFNTPAYPVTTDGESYDHCNAPFFGPLPSYPTSGIGQNANMADNQSENQSTNMDSGQRRIRDPQQGRFGTQPQGTNWGAMYGEDWSGGWADHGYGP
ncbi:MAG: hypothetical protein LQ350_001340 [Teloschistes chrysophthalmus]|nr:MAG: hypothetical protein LQ350_001340 [Niorma chrysophthalma]